MTSVDVEIARLIYLVSALGIVLFTSMLCRWLWRPLRFLLLAAVISLFFTPFFVDQDMPDGKTQNIVPAFVVMIYDGVNDREHWREAIKRAGGAIAAVGTALGFLALLLALFLPKPPRVTTAKKEPPTKKDRKNPYLPDDFEETIDQKTAGQKVT